MKLYMYFFLLINVIDNVLNWYFPRSVNYKFLTTKIYIHVNLVNQRGDCFLLPYHIKQNVSSLIVGLSFLFYISVFKIYSTLFVDLGRFRIEKRKRRRSKGITFPSLKIQMYHIWYFLEEVIHYSFRCV